MNKKRNNTNLLIKWLNEVDDNELVLVGGKAVNIGRLVKEGINCPPGFCITTKAFEVYLNNSGIKDRIIATLGDYTRSPQLIAAEIKKFRQKIEIPQEVRETITKTYKKFQNQFGQNIPLAVRSSASVEDLKNSSFAGQFDSFLGIVGEEYLVQSVKKCWDSLFNARSIAYIQRKRLKIAKLQMGVIVQKLIAAKAAGVMFTIHPVTLEKNCIVIESTFGLGNQLVSGEVNPDTFLLKKDTLKITQRGIAEKRTFVKFDPKTNNLTKNKVTSNLQNNPSLTSRELIGLAKLGKQIENFFGFPQDIEWVIEKGKIYIVQARPMTVI